MQRAHQVNIRVNREEKSRLEREAKRRGFRSISDYLRHRGLETVTKIYTYRIHVKPAREGGYVVSVPTLGCTTQGETYGEAIEMARDCIRTYLNTLADLGKPIPQEPEPTRPTDSVVSVQATVAS